MIELHPTPTASDGRPKQNLKLLAPEEAPESNFIECPHCGMRNDKNKVSIPSDDGSSKSYPLINIAIPSGTKSFNDPTVTAGCRFCGLNYRQSSYRQKFFSEKNLAGR